MKVEAQCTACCNGYRENKYSGNPSKSIFWTGDTQNLNGVSVLVAFDVLLWLHKVAKAEGGQGGTEMR